MNMAAMRHDIIYGHEKQISVHVKGINNKGSVVHGHYSTETSPSNKKTDITTNRKTSKLNDIKQEFSSRNQIMRDGKSVVKGQKAELKDKVVDSKRQHVAEIAEICLRPKTTRDNRPKSARPDSRFERKRDTAGRENFNQTNKDPNLHSPVRPKSARPDSRMLISKAEYNNHLHNENSERLLDNIRLNGQRNCKYVENEPAKYPNNANVKPKSYAPTRYEEMDIIENDNSKKFTRYHHISFHNEGQEKSSQGHTDIHNLHRINEGTINLDQPAHTYVASQLNFEDDHRQQSYSRNPHNVISRERKVEPMDLTTEFHNEDLNIDPVEYFWRETESCSEYNCSYCQQKQKKALLMPQTKVPESNESRSKVESSGGSYSNYTNKAKQFLETDIGFHRNRSSSVQIPRSQAYVNNVSNQQTVFSFRPRIKSDTEAQKSIVRDVDFDIEDSYASTRPPSPLAKDKTFISSKNHKSRKQSLPFPSHPVYHKMSVKVMEKYRYIRPATFTESVMAPSGAPEPDFNQLKPRKLKPIRMPIQSKKN